MACIDIYVRSSSKKLRPINLLSRCECLFGISMRKPGVSMVVSVELSEIQEARGERMEFACEQIAAPDRGDRPAVLPSEPVNSD